jgi:prohibitin 2
VRGTALSANPEFIKLQILQTWNGKSPLVVGAGGSNVMMSLEDLARRAVPASAPRPAPRDLSPTAATRLR